MYSAQREPDGTYSIFDVPVFAEVPKGQKGAPFDLDRAWLQAAVDVSKVRAREGYLAPLHFQHHDGKSDNYKSGHYALTRVGKENVGGVRKWTVYANFTKLTDADFAAIMSGHVPYRSVEIDNYEDKEIESLALLSHHTPFHKFALLNSDTVKLSIADEAQRDTAMASTAGPVAFAQTGHGYAGLFCFRDQPKEGVTMKLLTVDGVPTLVDAEGEVIQFAVDPSIKFMSPEDEDDKTSLPKDKEGLKKMQKAINAALSKFMDEDDDDAEKKNSATPAEADDDKDYAKLSKMFARMDALEGELQATKATFAKAKSETEATKRLTDAVNMVKAKGYHVSKATQEHFSTFAHDADALDAQIKHYLRVARPDGPETLEDDSADTNDAVMAKFSALGESAHQVAVELDNHFSQLVTAGHRKPDDREKFITRGMEYRGFKATG